MEKGRGILKKPKRIAFLGGKNRRLSPPRSKRVSASEEIRIHGQ